ncbi:MAG: hypothetical protein LT080_11140 [Thiobacillus sp.]|nr:hypothetical protein [Thiobacillus sp.]
MNIQQDLGLFRIQPDPHIHLLQDLLGFLGGHYVEHQDSGLSGNQPRWRARFIDNLVGELPTLDGGGVYGSPEQVVTAKSAATRHTIPLRALARSGPESFRAIQRLPDDQSTGLLRFARNDGQLDLSGVSFIAFPQSLAVGQESPAFAGTSAGTASPEDGWPPHSG